MESPNIQEIDESGTQTRTERSLPWSILWTSLGTVAMAVSNWGGLVILAKMASTEVVGDFALTLAIATPVAALAFFAIRPMVATDAVNEFRFQDYLGVQLASCVVCMGILILIAVLGYFHAEVNMAVLTVGTAKLIEGTSNVFYGLMLKHNRTGRMAVSMVTKATGGLVALSLGYHFTGSIAVMGMAVAVWWILILLFIDVPCMSRLLIEHEGGSIWSYRPRFYTLWKVVCVCAPAGGTTFLRMLNQNIAPYFIQVFLGRTSLGIFAASMVVSRAVRLLFVGLSQAVGPRLSQYYRKRPDAYLGLILKMLAVALVLGVSVMTVAWLLGRFILTVVFQPEFADSHGVLVLLLLAATVTLQYNIIRIAMIAARYLVALIAQVLATTVVTGISCWLLVPQYGLVGAAGALVISAVFELVLAAFLLIRKFRSEQCRIQISMPAGS